MKFRKKPVVIDAEQYSRDRDMPNGVCLCIRHEGPHTHTLEGVMTVSEGDWIIRGVKGEYYPCKPDIFAATYEEAGK